MKKLVLLIFPLLLFPLCTPAYADDYQDGRDAYGRKDYKTAIEKWKPLAEEGNGSAQYFLGLLYDQGKGVPQDYKEAFKWYKLVAEQGNANAQEYVADVFLLRRQDMFF